MTGAEAIDFVQLEKTLEAQELEAPGGVASPQVYSQLLALYLLHNDLNSAKFLWKRIPQVVKTTMWTRDLPGIYETLNKEWSETVKHIMLAIQDQTRKRAFHLVAQAYSSITGDDFAAFVGMPVNEAVDAAVAEGWKADAQTRMLMPKRPEKSLGGSIPSEQQLSRLTDFVSYLEN